MGDTESDVVGFADDTRVYRRVSDVSDCDISNFTWTYLN